MLHIFTDHNVKLVISNTLDAYLKALKEGECVKLKDKFDPRISDIDYIRHLQEEDKDWIIITNDVQITRNRSEKEALRSSGMYFFALTKTFDQMTSSKQVSQMISIIDEIEKHIKKRGSEKIVKIPLSGKRLKPL